MQHTPLHILIVDDDEDDFALVEAFFDDIGPDRFQVEWAPTYEHALTFIKENRHDVYFLDYYLGEHTGMDLLHEIIARGCCKPIIMLTGRGGRDEDVAAMEAGATDYLVKSQLSADVLERSVRYALARKETEHALREKTEALERSNEDLEQFAYIVSHDLQEPLRTITSFVQLLRQRYANQLDQDADDFINYIVDGASHMKALIHDLLTYSRVGTQEIEHQSTDLNVVLAQTLETMRSTLEEAECKVTHDPLPTLEADPAQMSHLLQNLISNGVKFRGEAPARVHVSAKRYGGQWHVAVRDEGIGIKPTYQDQIFEVFRRLHSRSQYAGTGIGLAICKKIVERHGGRIWVESTLGQGTTFFFTLPTDSMARMAASDHPEAHKDTQESNREKERPSSGE